MPRLPQDSTGAARAEPLAGGGSMKSAEVVEFVFDSHRFVKRLTGAGMDEPVAEVLADEQVALLTGNLATKTALADTDAGLREALADTAASLRKELADTAASLRKELADTAASLRKELADTAASLRKELADTEARLRTELAATEARIRADLEKRLAELRAELMKWMFGALMAQAALIVALVKLLP